MIYPLLINRAVCKVIDEYVGLRCDECGKDLLEELYTSDYRSLVAEASLKSGEGQRSVVEIYFACKRDCDKIMERRIYERHGAITSWTDISDIAMPNHFLRYLIALINDLRNGKIYSDQAFDKEKHLLIALSQKVFREVTEAERQRYRELLQCF